MYINYILLSWTFPVFSFLPYTFVILFSVFPFLYGRINQHQIMPVELAQSPWRASHILSPSELHIEVDCFTQYRHISILPDSTLSYL